MEVVGLLWACSTSIADVNSVTTEVTDPYVLKLPVSSVIYVLVIRNLS